MPDSVNPNPQNDGGGDLPPWWNDPTAGMTHPDNFVDPVAPPQYTDGEDPWELRGWWHPAGYVSTSADAATVRTLSVSPSVLGSYVPCAYGSAKVTGQCCLLKKDSSSNWALIGFFFSHGEQNSVSTVWINDKTPAEWGQTDDSTWFSGYWTFTDGVSSGPAMLRTQMNTFGVYHDWPGMCGVVIKVKLGATSFPGSLNVAALLTGKVVSLHGGGTGNSTNPIDISHDIATDSDVWLGLAAGTFDHTTASGDWKWIAETCDHDVLGDGIKRWEYNGALGMRDSIKALREVLSHASCGFYHLDDRFLPIFDWRPRPIAGTVTISSGTVTGSGTTFLTDLDAGDVVYIDHLGSPYEAQLCTVVSVASDTSMIVTPTVSTSIPGGAYGARVRPISGVSVSSAQWIDAPEGSDIPVASAPDVVIVNHLESDGDLGQTSTRCEDPDGYDAATVKRVEITLNGYLYSAQAARSGHILRRRSALTPFQWSGTASPESGIGSLRIGDIFRITVRDGLTAQPVILDRVRYLLSGGYKVEFREYDLGVYADDDADNDTPISTNQGQPDPPDAPAYLNDTTIFNTACKTKNILPWDPFVGSGQMYGPESGSGWTYANISGSYDVLFNGHLLSTTGSSPATITSDEFQLPDLLPYSKGLLYFMLAIRDDNLIGSQFEVEYWSGPTGSLVERWSANITPQSRYEPTGDTRIFHFFYPIPFNVSTGNYHSIVLRWTNPPATSNGIFLRGPIMVPWGLQSPVEIVGELTFDEAATADETIDEYHFVEITPGERWRSLETMDQANPTYTDNGSGWLKMSFPIVQSAVHPRPGAVQAVLRSYAIGSSGPGGFAVTEEKAGFSYLDYASVEDVAASDRMVDWDDSGRAANKVPVVGSDGITKEYADIGTIPLGVDTIDSASPTLSLAKQIHVFDASKNAIAATVPDGTTTGQVIVLVVDDGTNDVTVTGKINSASSSTSQIYEGESFKFAWYGTYWRQIT